MTNATLLQSLSEAGEGSISNARLIAHLQALTVGIHLVGLDRVHEVYTSSERVQKTAENEHIDQSPEPNKDSPSNREDR